MTNTTVPGLQCIGHAGPHALLLNSRFGDTDRRPVADAVRTALLHAFVGQDDDPECARIAAVAQAVVDRAAAGEPDVTDAEAAAVIAAAASGMQYMTDNHYAGNEEFPEDAWAATVLQSHVVGICWKGR